MKIRELEIRPISLGEMMFPMEVAYREGQNPGLYDGVTFLQAAKEGYLLAEVEGKPIGAAAGAVYGGRLAYLGGVFTLPPFRHKGLGRKLWEICLSAAEKAVGDGVIGVNGLPEKEDFYTGSDFWPSHMVLCYKGRIFEESCLGFDIYPASEVDPIALEVYDGQVFGAPRQEFLRCWLEQPGLETACLVEKGLLKGYGCMRRCREGWRLGPVFAREPRAAEKILKHLACKTAGEPAMLELPEPNQEAVRLAFRLGMFPAGVRRRFYKGGPPAFPLEQIYGYTTLDIG